MFLIADQLDHIFSGVGGEFHSVPESVAAFEGYGTVRTVIEGDGAAYQVLEIQGTYVSASNNWNNALFRWYVDPSVMTNHRLLYLTD
jgi:hypothetical protein